MDAMRECGVCGMRYADVRETCPACGSPPPDGGAGQDGGRGRRTDGGRVLPRTARGDRGAVGTVGRAEGDGAGMEREESGDGARCGRPPARGLPLRPPPSAWSGPPSRPGDAARGPLAPPVSGGLARRAAAPPSTPRRVPASGGVRRARAEERRRRAGSLRATARAALVLSAIGLVLAVALPWFVVWSADPDDPEPRSYDARLQRVTGDEGPSELTGGTADVLRDRIWLAFASMAAGATLGASMLLAGGDGGWASRPSARAGLAMLLVLAGAAAAFSSAAFLARTVSVELGIAFSEGASGDVERGVSPAAAAVFAVGAALALRGMLMFRVAPMDPRGAEGGAVPAPGHARPWSDRTERRSGRWSPWRDSARMGSRASSSSRLQSDRLTGTARAMLVASVVGLVAVPLLPWVAIEGDAVDGTHSVAWFDEAAVHGAARAGDRDLGTTSLDLLLVSVSLALAAAFSAVACAGAVLRDAGRGDAIALAGCSAAVFASFSITAQAFLLVHIVQLDDAIGSAGDGGASASFGGNLVPLVCTLVLLVLSLEYVRILAAERRRSVPGEWGAFPVDFDGRRPRGP